MIEHKYGMKIKHRLSNCKTLGICRIGHFAELFSKKLGMSASALKKTLWGDFYLETKTKRIKRGAQVSCDSRETALIVKFRIYL